MLINMHRFLYFIGVVPLLFSAANASACSCLVAPPPEKAFSEADVVFVGNVISIKEEKSSGDNKFMMAAKDLFGLNSDFGYWRYLVKLQVSIPIKGVSSKNVVVRTNVEGSACGFHFEPHSNYLVYGYVSKDGIHTTHCTRTKPIEKEDVEVEALLSLH
jgi:hypothetical protein